MFGISKETKEAMERQLLGKRIRCIRMDDPYRNLTGEESIVKSIDDIGQIHVDWDCGSTLALCEEDIWEVI